MEAGGERDRRDVCGARAGFSQTWLVSGERKEVELWRLPPRKSARLGELREEERIGGGAASAIESVEYVTAHVLVVRVEAQVVPLACPAARHLLRWAGARAVAGWRRAPVGGHEVCDDSGRRKLAHVARDPFAHRRFVHADQHPVVEAAPPRLLGAQESRGGDHLLPTEEAELLALLRELQEEVKEAALEEALAAARAATEEAEEAEAAAAAEEEAAEARLESARHRVLVAEAAAAAEAAAERAAREEEQARVDAEAERIRLFKAERAARREQWAREEREQAEEVRRLAEERRAVVEEAVMQTAFPGGGRLAEIRRKHAAAFAARVAEVGSPSRAALEASTAAEAERPGGAEESAAASVGAVDTGARASAVAVRGVGRILSDASPRRDQRSPRAWTRF